MGVLSLMGQPNLNAIFEALFSSDKHDKVWESIGVVTGRNTDRSAGDVGNEFDDDCAPCRYDFFDPVQEEPDDP